MNKVFLVALVNSGRYHGHFHDSILVELPKNPFLFSAIRILLPKNTEIAEVWGITENGKFEQVYEKD